GRCIPCGERENGCSGLGCYYNNLPGTGGGGTVPVDASDGINYSCHAGMLVSTCDGIHPPREPGTAADCVDAVCPDGSPEWGFNPHDAGSPCTYEDDGGGVPGVCDGKGQCAPCFQDDAGACQPKRASGVACTADGQCLSGACGATGTGNCCAAACTL